MAETYKTTKNYDNWFATTLEAQLSASGVGEYQVLLADEPTDEEGWLVLEPGATNKREIIRYWKPDTWTGFVYTNDENRGLDGGNSALLHLSGVAVEMRNVAQQAAYDDKFIDKIKYALVEAASTTGLTLKIAPFFGEIAGTRVAYNGTTHFEGTSPVDGTSFTGTDSQSVTDSATNYVELDSAGAIQINTTAWGTDTDLKRLAIVTASGGNITSVIDSRSFGEKPTPGVTSIAELGETGITGDVKLVEGSNVTISQSGQQITLNASTSGTSSVFLRETPSGSINGANTSFTVTQAPASAYSILLWLNGVSIPYGSGAGKFTISGTTITMGTAPLTGSVLDCQITY